METEHRRQPEAAEIAARPIFAGLLIGGASTRMGRDKALLDYRGCAFAEQIVAILAHQTRQVVLLGEGARPTASGTIPCLPDAPGLVGPIAGIIAALRWRPGACWIIAACDLPLVSAAALEWLLAQRQPGCWAVLPAVATQRVEPLLAVYEPEALPLLEQVVAEDRRSPSRIALNSAVHTPAVPERLRACWTNVNTPEEYRRLCNGLGKHNPRK